MNQPKPRTEYIERYCPHICRNVPLLRRQSDREVVFSCLLAEGCEVRKRVAGGCVEGKVVRETRGGEPLEG